MTSYRLYCLDGMNKVASAEWIEADDDRHAIELAYGLKDGAPCELWQNKRFVIRLDRKHDE